MNQDADEQMKQSAVMDFVYSYGLFGFMTALPTTLEFITYEYAEPYEWLLKEFTGWTFTYHIELLEKPTIVWDFQSLLLAIQIMFSFMLTDEKSSLKVCKHCGKVFLASRPKTVFCSGQCKNQYNVYKSRGKIRNDDIWMNQSALAKLYNTTPQNITMHIRNIYADGELDEFSTCRNSYKFKQREKEK